MKIGRHLRFRSIIIVIFLFQILALNTLSLVAQDASIAEPPAQSTPEVISETTLVAPTIAPTDALLPTATSTGVVIEPPIPTETSAESPALTATLASRVPITLPVDTPEGGIPDANLTLLFSDDFNSGTVDLWTLGEGWALTPSTDGLALASSGSTQQALFVYDDLSDVALEARFLMMADFVQFTIRQSGTNSYKAILHSNGEVLVYRGETLLGSGNVNALDLSQWHTMRLSAFGTLVSVILDDVEIIELEDSEPLLPGTLGFAGPSVLIDDVKIFIPSVLISEPPVGPVDVDLNPPSQGVNISLPVTTFRTQVTAATPYKVSRLASIGATVLAQTGDTFDLLVTDSQLELLAQLGYEPRNTNEVTTLLSANENRWLTLSFATSAQMAFASPRTVGTGALNLSPEQMTAMSSLSSIDDDADGLTNTQETWWCTNSSNPDSDTDGVTDGAEVQAAKDWLANRSSSPPANGVPFNGWPPQIPGCLDGDQDSVPDLAETWDLGLNRNRESTDRDKFDDGQELFGITYCPGSAGACGYGLLPRVDDGILIGSNMPSWVEAPGNHPLVAAYPIPEVDIAPSSLHVQAVTTITTDHVIGSGTEHSYSTAETEGTSTSVADTVTWNEWQEVSRTTPDGISSHNSVPVLNPNFVFSSISSPGRGYTVTGATLGFGAALAVGAGAVVCAVAEPCGLLAFGAGLGLVAAGSTLYGEILNANADSDSYDPTAPRYSENNPTSVNRASDDQLVRQNGGTVNTQDRSSSVGSTTYNISNSGNTVTSQHTYAIQFPIQRPTTTVSSGKGWGGSQTSTHTEYEEQTVTNGEAFSNNESWSNATAIDTAHAADFWFTYTISNTGTEYAREIANLAFNIYIGDDPNPAYTYFVAPEVGGDGKFHNFMPNELHTYTSRHLPLSLDQMRAIDLGAPIRVVMEDFTYGADELFYGDATGAGVTVAMEDGTDDGDEAIDTYVIPIWNISTVQDVLARYFPHDTDADGNLTAIWTPEYRADTPAWCVEPNRVGTALWCKHALSTADWWNIYMSGLGDGTAALQDTTASAGSTILFRFNSDSDLDGYSDRSELRLQTDPNDAASFPRPEVIAGLHSTRTGSNVTATLSLLNTGLYDAYGVEAVMIAPDDSISITNNTVGGSGRVGAQRQIIVGSRILQPVLNTWSGTAKPASDGYYIGTADRVYNFIVQCSVPGGCDVGSGAWNLSWSDNAGASGVLPLGAGYTSPTLLNVGAFGLKISLLTGKANNGNTFTVEARTPRDTFQYTINREPFTEPIVLVSYNDPQGSHRFITPVRLTLPTDNLANFSNQMLREAGVEIVTTGAFNVGANTTNLVVNNPSGTQLTNAHLYLEFIDPQGNVVSEVPTTATLPAGPSVVPVTWNTSGFSPAYDANQDYIVLAFWTDYQGNILDTAGRPLSSFQSDPRPDFALATAAQVWDFGAASQGTLLQRQFVLGNIGYMDLLTYVGSAPGIIVSSAPSVSSGPLAPGDMAVYTVGINTDLLPTGFFERTIPIRTSDADSATQTITIRGTITPFVADTPAGSLLRPLDVTATISGSHAQGEWVTKTQTLGPNPQSLHPARVYSQNYSTLWGVGRYATEFGQGTASAEMFGTGRDGDLTVANGQQVYVNNEHTSVNASAGQNVLNVVSTTGFNIGDEILIAQMQGTGGVGQYEFATIQSVGTNTITLQKNLQYGYQSSGVSFDSGCGIALSGQFFNNQDLSGSTAFSHCESVINFDWGSGHPGNGVNSDHFSIRWIGILYAPVSQNYTFNIDADDGIRIYLDDISILDEWHSASQYTINPFISAGAHNIRIEYYENGGDAKLFLTTSDPNVARAQIIRIPHYHNVTVQSGGTLVAPLWDGFTGGILAFRSNGLLSVAAGGTINISGSGYRGGSGTMSLGGRAALNAFQGATISGLGVRSTAPNNTGGGGGTGGDAGAGGGGGGYATPGVNGTDGQGSGGSGGGIIGAPELTSLYFGGGGGAGRGESNANCAPPYAGGDGGRGGGIMLIFSSQITLQGSVTAAGAVGGDAYGGCEEGAGGGGAGAGGSVLIRTSQADVGTLAVLAPGGTGGDGSGSFDSDGGSGGDGRIRIEYCDTLTGTTNPVASTQKLNCFITEQVETTPFNSYRLNLPETFPNGRSYRVQYGRRVIFTGSGQQTQTTNLRVARQLYSTASLNILLNNAGTTSANPNLCIDIGNDGVCDYTRNAATTFPADLSASNLAPALNAYLLSRNEIAWGGQVDVPVRVQINRQADVILTNMRLTPSGAKNRFVRLLAQSYSNVSFGLQITQPGVPNGALSLAVDVGADGTIDWSDARTTAFPVSINTANLSAAVNAYLAGKTGEVDVPLRIYYSPTVSISVNQFTAAAAVPADVTLTTSDINFNVGTPTDGDAVTLTATFHNTGGSDSGSITAFVVADLPNLGNVYVGSLFVPNVPPGGTAQGSLVWNTLGFTGNIPLQLVVDPYNRLVEGHEDNNQASKNITIFTRPDLAVQDIMLSDPEPIDGQPVTLHVTLENNGQTNAGASTLTLYDGNPASGGSPITESSVSVNGQGTAGVDFSWTPTGVGSKRLFVISDRTNVVNESDENNNLSWQDIYVGFAGPLLLDSGNGSESPYTAATGFGYLNGQASTFCGTQPEQSQRSEPTGEVQYQFDHLLPGHYYHLDITLYECDGLGRQETIWLDGNLVSQTLDLSDGLTKHISLRLDPAFYADHSLTLGIREMSGSDAVVAAVNLYDIDYRYADSGGNGDLIYPHGDLPFGWLDGVANPFFGTLPYQSRRIENSDSDPTDDPDNELRYRFDGLDVLRRYQVLLTFYQQTGTTAQQSIQIDNTPVGQVTIVAGQPSSEQAFDVPFTTYSTDGSIVVKIIRTNALAGAFVNIIALEEETIPLSNTLPTISDITNRSIDEDASTSALPFTIGDAETLANDLIVSATSSNSTLVPNSTTNIILGGSGANRTITLNPAANQSGTTTMTVNVLDGSGGSASDTFVLTVNPVNDAPTISNVADLSTNVNIPTAALAFTVGDAETAAGSLMLTKGSSNTTLVPLSGISFGGSGTSRTVTVTPATGQSGTATITVTVSDGTLSTSDTFVLTVTTPADAIFSDGFESGNLSAWSANVNDGGDLSVTGAAALTGGFGMQTLIDDATGIYVTDDTPNAEARYRARFYFQPKTLVMGAGENFILFKGYQGTSTQIIQIQVRQVSGVAQIRLGAANDNAQWVYTAFFPLTNAAHLLEFDWQAASSAGANNGSLTLWIDEVQKAQLTGINSDLLRVDRVRLGAISDIDAGTSGTLLFDGFISRRVSYIGALIAAPTLNSPANNAFVARETPVSLSWNSVASATSYYAEFTNGTSVNLNSGWQAGTSWAPGLQPQGVYTWRVKARLSNGEESLWSAVRTLTVRPGKPTNLLGTAQSMTQVNLNWTASVDAPSGIDGYNVYREGTFVNATSSSTTTFSDTTAAACSANHYTVRAYKGSVESADSNTRTVTTPCDAIFSDGFESGNLNAWSANLNDGGDLSVLGAAQLTGSSYGMRAILDDRAGIYVTDDTPNAEARYRARFYFRPKVLVMAASDNFVLFKGYQGTSTTIVQLQVRQVSGVTQVRFGAANDSAQWVYTAFFPVSNAAHFLELDWQAASSAGANNGSLTFWLDDVQKAQLTGIDSDLLRIDRVRLGAVSDLDAGTSGTLLFDAFVSRRLSYIGAESGGLSVIVEPTETPRVMPTAVPTETLIPVATDELTPEATVEATPEATDERTPEATTEATDAPTTVPTDTPTGEPTAEPTETPTPEPTVAPTLLPFLVPVFQTMDDGAPLWSASSAAWLLSAEAAYTGLGWQAWASGQSETLTLNVPVNLGAASAPTLTFQSRLLSASPAEVRVSLDGMTWQTVAAVAPSADWTQAQVSLAAYAGQTIRLQFAWASPAGSGDTWQVDEVTIADQPVVQPPLEPTAIPTETPNVPGVEPTLAPEPPPELPPAGTLVPIEPRGGLDNPGG